jgi:hypothetical protein
MVPAGSPHLPGWLGHWGYTALAPQVPLAELPTTAPETGPPDGGWRLRQGGIKGRLVQARLRSHGGPRKPRRPAKPAVSLLLPAGQRLRKPRSLVTKV